MPTSQKFLTYLYWVFLGAMALGGVIGVLNDTFDFVTLPIAVAGTVFIALFWVGAQQYLKRKPWKTENSYITRLNIGIALPLLGMVILLWLPQAVNIVTSLTLPRERSNEILILIANFDHTDGVMNANIHGEIYRALTEKIAELGLSNIRVHIDRTVIPAADREVAQELGRKYNASFIIWGTDTGVRLEVKILNLKLSNSIPVTLDETESTQLAQPQAYNNFVIYDLPSQITYLVFSALGQAAYNQSDFELALQLTQEAVNTLPQKYLFSNNLNQATTYFLLAWLYQQPGQLDNVQAINNYGKVIQIDPNYTGAFINRGIIYKTQGNFDLALADFSKALQINQNSVNAYINRGYTYYAQSNFNLAIADYNQALQIEPNNVGSYIGLGIAYYAQGDFNQAIYNYHEALQIDPNNTDTYLRLGNAYKAQGDLLQAFTNYSLALQTDPNNINVYISRGNAYKNEGALDLAINDYNKALQIDSNLAGAYHGLGNVYYDKGDLDLAIEKYTEALLIDPNYAIVYVNRGNVYKAQGELDLAIADYSTALQINSNDTDTYLSRGNAYNTQGNSDLALLDYTKTVQIDPNYVGGYINRGTIYSAQGNLDLAIADYSKAIQIDPNAIYAYINRGNAYYQQGNMIQALEDYQNFLKLTPDDPNRAFVESRIEEIQKLGP